MPRIIGRLTKIGIGKETVRGTAVAPTYWVPVRELDFDDQTELTSNESGYGNIVDTQDQRITKTWGEGSYGGKIFDRSVGLELTGVFGQSPTSVQRASSGVYDHTYTMANNNNHQSLTVAVAEDNYSGRFPLGVVNTWTLEAELGDYVRRTMSLITKKSASSTETPAYTDEVEFIPKHMSVKFAAAGANDATLTAATAAKVRAFTLEINKNAVDNQVFGSTDLDNVVNRQVSISGSFEVYYDDRTYHTLAANATFQSIRVEMLNTDVTIGTSHNPALRFDLSNVSLAWPERGFDNNDITTLTVNYTGMLNIATGSAITARLTNAFAGTNY